MSVDLEAIKLRIDDELQRQLAAFDRETELHFIWLDELLPAVEAVETALVYGMPRF
jgi:hypothetical protein